MVDIKERIHNFYIATFVYVKNSENIYSMYFIIILIMDNRYVVESIILIGEILRNLVD